MFARYFLELPLSASAIEEALLDEPGQWIPGLVEDVERRGEALLGKTGMATGKHRQKRVVIELREPIRFPSRMVLPMTWRAASKQSLFPVFDADLEVAELEEELTQLSISARYRPPLGAVGAAMDKAFLHRVAETMVKDFLDRAGEQLLVSSSGSSPEADDRSPDMGP